jgi:hypothetical protein
MLQSWWWCCIASAGLGLGRHLHSLTLLGLTPSAGASQFIAAPAGLLSPLVCSLPIYISRGILPLSPPDVQVFIVSFSDNEQVCPPLPFPSCSTKPWKCGRRGMGVPDLLPMAPVRWLSITCLHGISFTTVSTLYASTTSMYLSPILPSLQKILCCSSIVLGVSFLLR